MVAPPLSATNASGSAECRRHGPTKTTAATLVRSAPKYGGEARTCLGWLYETSHEDGGEAYVKQLRQAKDKAGSDPRPVWDQYYFQLLRNQGKDVFTTAALLSKGSDPAGILAYLNSLLARTNGNVSRVRRAGKDGQDQTPPLPADQLGQVLDCYARLKKAKPEWATSQVAQSVMTELKRAGRAKEEKALYDEMIKDSSTTVAKLRLALGVAADRKDLEGCLALFSKLEKLQPPPKTSAALNQLPTRQASNNLVTLMGKLADDKRFADVLKVLDLYLATARKQNLTTVKSASSKDAFKPAANVIVYTARIAVTPRCLSDAQRLLRPGNDLGPYNALNVTRRRT